MFLYIVPLKQGLKPSQLIFPVPTTFVFIHSSIKTRIETIATILDVVQILGFLYIVPLKQGLKPRKIPFFTLFLPIVFIHSSIKTRIETTGNILLT